MHHRHGHPVSSQGGGLRRNVQIWPGGRRRHVETDLSILGREFASIHFARRDEASRGKEGILSGKL
jgi:hypothetical protein